MSAMVRLAVDEALARQLCEGKQAKEIPDNGLEDVVNVALEVDLEKRSSDRLEKVWENESENSTEQCVDDPEGE